MARHVVREGECIETVAFENLRLHVTLLEENPDLSAKRKNPNVLAVGDELEVEPPTTASQTVTTSQLNRFIFLPGQTLLRMQVFGDPALTPGTDEPPLLKNQPFEVRVDGAVVAAGTTDGEARFEVQLPTLTSRAKLVVGDEDTAVFSLAIGFLDPEELDAGVQARLRNLGYDVGAVDGVLTARSRAAIESFQRDQGLQPSGEADDETRAALVREHGC